MKALNSFSQRSLHLILLLPFLCHEVAANTEIINFWPSREPRVDISKLGVVGNGSMLHPTDNEQRWSLEPAALHTPLHQVCERTDEPPFSCPHELWLFLDLDDAEWAAYATFTLRLSWAASTPADFAIALYTSQEVLDWASEPERAGISSNASALSVSPHTSSSTGHTPTTRSKYARIRTVNAGVPTPGSRSHPFSDGPAPIHGAVQRREMRTTVPFVVILEPVYWGVLPASLLPTVGFLVFVVLAAAALVPWVIAFVEPFVRQARVDATTRMTSTNIIVWADKDR